LVTTVVEQAFFWTFWISLLVLVWVVILSIIQEVREGR